MVLLHRRVIRRVSSAIHLPFVSRLRVLRLSLWATLTLHKLHTHTHHGSTITPIVYLFPVGQTVPIVGWFSFLRTDYFRHIFNRTHTCTVGAYQTHYYAVVVVILFLFRLIVSFRYGWLGGVRVPRIWCLVTTYYLDEIAFNSLISIRLFFFFVWITFTHTHTHTSHKEYSKSCLSRE